MTWSKLDDRFWSSQQISNAGNEAAGVYARALSYCGCQETDGNVPEDIAKYIGRPKAWTALVDEGLVDALDNGYRIPDYCRFNPSRAQLEAKRQADRERKAGSK